MQIYLGPGLGQGVTSIHPAASLQTATNWRDNKRNGAAKFSLSESIPSNWGDWKLPAADVSPLTARCCSSPHFPGNSPGIKVKVRRVGPGEAGERPYINKERPRLRGIKAW